MRLKLECDVLRPFNKICLVNNENRVGAVGFVGVIEPAWLQATIRSMLKSHPAPL